MVCRPGRLPITPRKVGATRRSREPAAIDVLMAGSGDCRKIYQIGWLALPPGEAHRNGDFEIG